MNKPLGIALAAGLVIGALAWIDPLFIPLVLAGPVISGALAGARRVKLRWVTLAWAVAGVSMIVSDWIANHEDRLFHVIITLVMVGLAAGGWYAAVSLRRRSSVESAMEP